ncbi:PHP domain-containing protein [Niallia sp. 03133]|uniref:PHP domain-containing protein n=1 Tax=Niallia sp. 03133 TaxID=3458060 RepID=UPI004043FBC5
MKIDLHMHTTCSDGELSPEELVFLARQKSVNIMAITDHDEIAGYWSAKNNAERCGISLIPGIEINTSGPNGELHILGYGINFDHPKLQQYIIWRKQERKRWSRQIVEKLRELGYNIEWENCFKRAEGGVIVRTHIAEELASNQYFSNAKEAYDALLIKGKAAFVERSPFSSLDAIELIHLCGGKAFIAHPSLYTFSWSLEVLVKEGIDGIEAYYFTHDQEATEYWLNQAKHHQLLISAGSDFHGKSRREKVGSVDCDPKLILPWLESIRKVDVRT